MTTAEILAAATPRPWHVSDYVSRRVTIASDGYEKLAEKERYLANHLRIAGIESVRLNEEITEAQHASAALIVLAVNAYERDQRVIKALSEALEQAQDAIEIGKLTKAIHVIDAALTLAKEAQGDITSTA